MQDRKNGCRCGQENIDELLQTLAKNCGEILNGAVIRHFSFTEWISSPRKITTRPNGGPFSIHCRANPTRRWPPEADIRTNGAWHLDFLSEDCIGADVKEAARESSAATHPGETDATKGWPRVQPALAAIDHAQRPSHSTRRYPGRSSPRGRGRAAGTAQCSPRGAAPARRSAASSSWRRRRRGRCARRALPPRLHPHGRDLCLF